MNDNIDFVMLKLRGVTEARVFASSSILEVFDILVDSTNSEHV